MIAWSTPEGVKPEGRVLLAVKFDAIPGLACVRCMVTGEYSEKINAWVTDFGDRITDKDVMGWTTISYPDGEIVK